MKRKLGGEHAPVLTLRGIRQARRRPAGGDHRFGTRCLRETPAEQAGVAFGKGGRPREPQQHATTDVNELNGQPCNKNLRLIISDGTLSRVFTTSLPLGKCNGWLICQSFEIGDAHERPCNNPCPPWRFCARGARPHPKLCSTGLRQG
jgi:hypothetical protein